MSQAVSSKSLCNRHQHMNQTSRFLSFFGLCVVSLFFLLTSQLAYPEPVEIPPGWYEVKAQTLLPNLHESLRYTDTQKNQCLDKQDASSLFPILDHVSFVGCELVAKHASEDLKAYALVCKNPQAATGEALFSINDNIFNAVLNIKMGGKNMKFSQRITGNRLSACK